MLIPDLTRTAKSEHGYPGHCPSVTAKRKLSDGPFYWTKFQLKWEVTDREALDRLTLPSGRLEGDRAYIEAAFDGDARYGCKIGYRDAFTDLSVWTRVGRNRGPGFRAPAQIESVEVKAQTKSVVVTYTVLVRMPDTVHVAEVYELLDCDVDVEVTQRQEMLPWTGKGASMRPDEEPKPSGVVPLDSRRKNPEA